MTTMARNEDWLRGGYWDFPGVETLDALLQVLALEGRTHAQQAAGLQEFMALSAWNAAPARLQSEVAAFLVVEASWREADHPRVPGGKGGGQFTGKPGGGKPHDYGKLAPFIRRAEIRRGKGGPVTPADIEMVRREGVIFRDTNRALMRAKASLEDGDRKGAIGHLREAAILSRDLGDTSNGDLMEAMAASLTSPAEEGFKGPLAGKVKLGGDPAAWPAVAASFEQVPPDLQKRLAPVVNEVRLVSEGEVEFPPDVLPPPGLIVYGSWTKNASDFDPGVLQVVTRADATHVGLHEEMHALDEASGMASRQPDWQILAANVRGVMEGRIGTEYRAEFRGGQTAGEELWAEMASQVLEGRAHLNVSPFAKEEGTGPGDLPANLDGAVRAELAKSGVRPRG